MGNKNNVRWLYAIDYPEIVINEISLALLEDTGWYYVYCGLFRHGKGLGCDSLIINLFIKGKTSFGREYYVNKN